MKLSVLISCMYENDTSIIERTKVQTDVVVVNQCDTNDTKEFDFINRKGEKCHAKFISTTERGLSRSRNMAIANAADADVCLICDDDEELEYGYENLILEGYVRNNDADFIAFRIDWDERGHTYPMRRKKLGLVNLLRTSSQQISFKKSAAIDNQLQFDPKMGSGTGNGGNEEIKFLMDARRAGLKLYYEPALIAKIQKGGDSKWFNGFDRSYLVNLSWSNRRALGNVLGGIYMISYCFTHTSLYKGQMNFLGMLGASFEGYMQKR